MFAKGSRYSDVEEATITDDRGRIVRYIKVRFIPQTSARLGHIVSEGERPDQIASRHYRDPERFWRLCDANEVMWPDDLVAEPGRTIRVPPVQG
jgi:hypothetical protein